MLPMERAKASFEVARMSEALYGGADAVKRRRFIMMPAAQLLYPEKHEWTREELMKRSIDDFINIHKDFVQEGYRPQRDEVSWMGEIAGNTGSMMPHYGLFLPTIVGQGSPEQVATWLPRALNFEIIGCYAQTELAHGSAIRALQTQAVYDVETGEFILDTPTLGAMKWWNSNIGCVATHAAVYAQLIVQGKEYGLHVFMVQVRDENHHCLPGIELGDCGRKLGDNAIDTGYMRLRGVRIPREHMFSKRQYVTRDGQYKRRVSTGGDSGKASALAKRASYLTMVQARAGMTSLSAGKLAAACTVAVRYSCVRVQGFADTSEGQSYRSAENQVIEYQIQRSRLFKQVAICYAMRASGSWMNEAVRKLSDVANKSDATMPEIHASSAGLKGLCTKLSADGMEDLRKCCGGHGFLLNSGIGSMATDFVWQVSAEGDWVVLLLQTARYLMNARRAALRGEQVSGLAACLEPLRDPLFKISSARPSTPQAVEDLLNLDLLLQYFQYRTLAATTKVGERLDAKMSKGMSFEAAWNACAVGLKRAAESHIYYFMLRNFVEVIRTQQDEHVVPVLERLCALFAVQNMVAGELWSGLLPEDLIDLAEEAEAQLLDALRPDAVALVDAFDIPDRVLNSTIGRSDGRVYEALYESARDSPLNQGKGKVPFEGYEEVLAPHLDKEFLKLRNKLCPSLADDQRDAKL
ncbi:Peroxisomal acyl-coenzyme A oxidase 1 [Hondaea fermentalgiana]|uniref:Acyl-coenzyme A oxidase n=1 Tax=Hondaea fermentalgiana TaxID=2315210 RepID=A0A2R5GUP3_9STRA|nr:Peroxisomal acyl-coenzyme A oxidase 1 [Hondaea fermentalgiana]|eukprot:GBG34285.1 Peroxisomal acyl-coenzyme A oxidase 1 [Hondaea fermentalgiana]